MNKLIIRILVIFLALVFLQNVYADGFGIKFGMNSAYITNVEPISGLELSRKLGLIGGVFYRADLGDTIAIQPEVYYSQKGIKAAGGFDCCNITGWDLLDYLEIPVLIKLKIPARGRFHPSLFVGPYVSYLINAKEKADIDGEIEETDIKEDLNTIDFGVCFGGNMNIDIGQSRIIIDIRYSLGLKKIPWAPHEPDSKNSVLSLMLGYAAN